MPPDSVDTSRTREHNGSRPRERVNGPPPSAAEPPALPEPPVGAIPALIEALLFVSDGPVEPGALARALNIPRSRVERACSHLAESLGERGIRLQVGPEGAQLVTAPEAAPYVEQFLGVEGSRRLSNAALETLAVVAYQQPVTRAVIEAIRGVSSDAAIATLRTRGLIAEGGRAPGPGRPTLFVTTQRFLEHFGLQRPDDLPGLDDLALPPRELPLPLDVDEPGGATTVTADTAEGNAARGRLPQRPQPSGPPGPAATVRRSAARRTGGPSLPLVGARLGLPVRAIGLPRGGPGPLPNGTGRIGF